MQADHPQKFAMAKHLQLSDEQLAKMKELKARYAGETRDLKYSLAAKRLEMRKLFTDPKTSDATLAAKQKELNSLRMQLMEKRGQMRLEWRKILTPEQLAKLDRMPHKHRGMRHGGGGV
jgi:Spy/CpxP family protein refolding chaperone